MAKPRLSTGRIPSQLGEDAESPTPPSDAEPIEEVYYYDRAMPTGATENAIILPTESTYD